MGHWEHVKRHGLGFCLRTEQMCVSIGKETVGLGLGLRRGKGTVLGSQI